MPRLKVLLASVAAICLIAGESQAADTRIVRLLNRTGTDIYGLFVAPSLSQDRGDADWSEDLLEGQRLEEGEEVSITFPWGAHGIWWNLMAENREGTPVVWHEIPIKRFRRITLLFRGAQPVIRGE